MLPSNVVYPLASQAGQTVGRFTGVTWGERTVREWYYQYHSNESKLLRDGRGRWELELIVHEEDLCRKLRRWARHHANAPSFVTSAAAFINEQLLKDESSEKLREYHLSLPIARSTAHNWLRAVNIQRRWARQNYFNDSHQNPLVLRQRAAYIPVREELELRMPLWEAPQRPGRTSGLGRT